MEQDRKLFVAQISFNIPDTGRVQLYAKDKAHAQELLTEMLKHVADLKILDIFEQETPHTDIEPPKGMLN